ncbi:hypothetical protein HDU79_010846 [Rhizoclosmatium sp. JEL0117]|nr:hypothetical protein HDU79_010846 [Rhizoclosmatium sp. JEL0117]
MDSSIIFQAALALLVICVLTGKSPMGLLQSLFQRPPSKEDLDKAKDVLDAALSSSHVVVVSKASCPYCIRVKSLLTSLNVDFQVVELSSRSDGYAIQTYLTNLTGQRTVPYVYIGGKLIGGCDDTVSLHSQGKLLSLLNVKA